MVSMEDAGGETEFTNRMVEIGIGVIPNTMIDISGNTFDILAPEDLSG